MGISYNKVILVGRLTADPETSYSSNGTTIAKFTVAVDRPVFKSSSNNQPETDFFRIVAFGKTAEFISNYFSKGKLVMIEGRIQINRWQDKEGVTKYFTDIITEKAQFMETKKASQQFTRNEPQQKDDSNERPFANNEVVSNDSEVFDGPDTSDDDEVPF